jgi:uncharacterized protein DUF4383
MQRPHLLPRRRAASTLAGRAPDPATADLGPSEPQSPPGGRVNTVHRVGAYLVASVIFVFGVLGFLGGLAFFSTSGDAILGMSTNGLLSTISVVTAAVLVVGASRGPKVASTVMLGIGALFLVSALANLALLRTSFNVLAFELSNVVFSVIAGLVLLFTGAYGRFSGNLPPDSPYARPATAVPEPPEAFPSTPEEFAAERAMRDAELAVIAHVATPDQQRRVAAMSRVRSREERRLTWMEFDALP